MIARSDYQSPATARARTTPSASRATFTNSPPFAVRLLTGLLCGAVCLTVGIYIGMSATGARVTWLMVLYVLAGLCIRFVSSEAGRRVGVREAFEAQDELRAAAARQRDRRAAVDVRV